MGTGITKRLGEYLEAVNGGDVETATAVFAPDGRMVAPGAAPAVGHTAIRAAMEGLMQMQPKLSLVTTEEVVDGDLAVEVGTWTLEMQPPNGPVISDQGNDVRVWRRDGAGTWQLLVDIWNSDRPSA